MKVEVEISRELHAFLQDRARGLTEHRRLLEEPDKEVTANDIVRLVLRKYHDEVG